MVPYFILPVSKALSVHHIKPQRNQRSQRGRTVVNHGIFEFGVMADGPAGEDFPDLRQDQGKQHHTEMFDGPEPQGENPVDIRHGMHHIFIGRFHKKVKDKSQYQPQVQQNNKAVLQIDTGSAIIFFPAKITPGDQKSQYKGDGHKQNTGPDVYLKDNVIHGTCFQAKVSIETGSTPGFPYFGPVFSLATQKWKNVVLRIFATIAKRNG